MKNKKGFTLVELIAVIAVLAVLVLVALPNVLGVFNKSIEEVMKIEETQATDAGSLYVRDHCGRTAKSKDDRSKCRNDVTTQKIEDKVYFCLSEIRGKGYIDEIKYKGNTKCDGIVLYDYDEEEVKFSEGKTYLVCDNDLYVTPELKEKEESIFNEYKKIINDCPNSSYEEAPEPEPNPNPEPNPTPTNSIYTVTLDNAGGTSTGNSQIYLKYGEGWYSDSEGVNSIKVVNIPIKTGNEFNGYYTGENGTGTKVIDENGLIQAGEEKVFNTNGTLYASWTSKVYKVELNNNGAITTGTTEIYEKYNVNWYSDRDAITEISLIVKPVKPGYIFEGYNLESGMKVIEETGKIIDGKTTIFTTDGQLNAVYTPRIYVVTLSQMYATTKGTETIFLKYNTGWYEDNNANKEINSIKVPKRTGYIFEGYYTKQDGKGEKVIDKNGKILSNKTTVISQDFMGALLFPNWKEDNSCSLAEAYYVGRVYPTVINGVLSKLKVINVLKNIDEEIDSNGKDYGQFSVKYDWRVSDGYNKWRVYAQEDGLYYTTKEKPTDSDLKPFTFLTWDGGEYANYYFYKKDCIKKPTGMTYVGSVFNSRPESFLQEAYVINNLTNVSEVASIHGSTKDYQNFVLNYDYAIGALDQWRLYAKEDDLFYSHEEASTFEELKPLSILTWNYSKEYKIYIYKKHKVDAPSDAIYVGQAFTTASNFNQKSLYAFDKINNKSELIPSSGLYDYTSFAITFDGRQIDMFDWRIYAQSDDIYYSEKETTNSSDLKLLSSLQWKYSENKKIYFYQKKLNNKPNNYTYIGSVFTAGLPSNHQMYGVEHEIDKNESKKSLCRNDSICDFNLFAVKYDGIAVDITDWKLYAKDDDIYYSEKLTTNEKDLKLLSSVYWKKNEFKRYFLYKKNKVDTPDNYTYVGSAFTAGISYSSIQLYGIDKIGNKKGLANTDKVYDYTSFSIGYDGRPVDHNDWRLYATDDDIYYSEKETTKESDLIPLSCLEWKKTEIKRYYFYKKHKVDTPSNFKYVGSAFIAGTSHYTLFVVDKITGTKKLQGDNELQTYSNFACTFDRGTINATQWRVYATNDDIYYSEKETTSLKDLNPLSSLQWKKSEIKKYYFYKKDKIDTPSNYTYVGSVFTSAINGTAKNIFVVNRLNNIKKIQDKNDSTQNYKNFEISNKWRITSIDDNLFYSNVETTKESNLIPLSKLEWKASERVKYYIYKKK